MKTIEEKAKAHDKALTKARMYRDNAKAAGDYAAVARYENIFPELRECEDERIRKKCIDFIRKWPSQKDRDECLAYLERQKEQKPECPDDFEDAAREFRGKCLPPIEPISDELVKIIKDEFEGFRNLLKKKGIDYEPHRSYWEGFARLFDSFAKEYVKEQKPIKVYRVENEDKQKGLWRKFDGTWEPLFDMLTDGLCRNLPMEDSDLYRAEGKKWFASAPSRETLQKWFSKRDLEELTAAGFTISEFEVTNYKKVSEFEYIFTRDSIINRTYLTVSDIYPEQKQEFISISEMVSKYRNTDEYDDDGHYKGKPINCMIRAYEQGIRDTLSKVKYWLEERLRIERADDISTECSPLSIRKWDKENEKMRYFVTEAVQSRYSDRELAKYLDPKIINEKKQLKQKLFAWLRCVRPSWKPTLEQIELLEKLSNHGSHYGYQNLELQKLVTQLRKL